MTRTLRFTSGDLQRFAEISGDRNPLHTDETFARRTPYGRCITHGALATIAALGTADPGMLALAEAVEVAFRQPVFPDEDYTISVAGSSAERIRVEVARAGRVALIATVTVDRGAPPLPDVGALPVASRRSAPQRHTIAGLAEQPPVISEPYECDVDSLAALAADLGAPDVPDAILLWLAAASYAVGMVVPGEDAVFAGGKITRAEPTASGALTGAVSAADDRTGLVVLDLAFDHPAAAARMALQAFLRTPVPPPDRASVGRYLAPSDRLSGRNVLVVGASRGLGAALAGCFASQGATVWAAFASSRDRAEALRSEFGPDRIRLLQFDAEDLVQTRQALAEVRASGPLDGVVLSAAPALQETSLHPDAAEGMLRFVRSSVALALVPLAESLEALAPAGWLAFVSSSALDDPPEGWPHYAVAKSALEGLAAYCGARPGARVLVVRPPKMWTDSVNTPLGRLGAIPSEQVAAAIVDWTVRESDARGTHWLTADELVAVASEQPSS